MAYIIYNETWESEFDNIVFKRNRVQNTNLNQLKLKLNDTFRKVEKLSRNFETTDDTGVKIKTYLDKKLSKIEGQNSYVVKSYNNNNRSVEKVLIQKAVKTTKQILYDKSLFDQFNEGNAYEVIKSFLFVEKHRPDFEKVNVTIQ